MLSISTDKHKSDMKSFASETFVKGVSITNKFINSFSVAEELVSFCCDICGKEFSTRDDAFKHSESHSKNSYFCEKTFARDMDLYRRFQTHTEEIEVYVCEFCQKIFFSKNNLKNHKILYAGEKPFTCEVCQEGSLMDASRKFVVIIYSRTHSGEKPYACEVCQKRFSQKGSMIKHFRTHIGEKPFVCNMCQKSFSQKDHLTKHFFIHKGEKPYMCEVCHKTYSHKRALLMHVQIHTGEKLYMCEICHCKFYCKFCLDKHLQIHRCEKSFSLKNYFL